MRGLVSGLMLVLAAGLVLAADGTPAPTGEEPVRVYTNADLEQLPPLANGVLVVQGERPTQGDAEAWEFVGEFLDREARRLEAERAHELERRRTEPDERVVDQGYYPLSYYGYGSYDGHCDRREPCGRGRHCDVHDMECGHARRRGHTDFAFGEPIRPIHAGPTKTQIMWAEATRRSGVDAFPSNRRSSQRGSHARGHRHSR